MPVSDRVFIVGCPRSGTTLLQSLLAAHPQAHSFPETHFFNHVAATTVFEKLTGLPGYSARKALEVLFDETLSIDAVDPWHASSRPELIRSFINALDRQANAAGAELWIEKTPSHLYRIDLIEQYVETPKFIHIIRRGCDVVASLYQVAQQYPDEWGGARSIDRCIDRWIEDVGRTEQHLDKPNHDIVQYETLCTSPEQTLQRLCQFLNLDYTGEMLRDYREVADDVVEDEEQWKVNNTESIRSPDSDKFRRIFDPDDKRRIIGRLSGAVQDWPAY